jgi:hypothetical protein
MAPNNNKLNEENMHNGIILCNGLNEYNRSVYAKDCSTFFFFFVQE